MPRLLRTATMMMMIIILMGDIIIVSGSIKEIGCGSRQETEHKTLIAPTRRGALLDGDILVPMYVGYDVVNIGQFKRF